MAAALLAASPGAGAAVREVPGAYPTIQAALNAAADGDVVNVAPGVYTGNVVVAKRVTLQGAGSGGNPALDTILQAATGGVPAVRVTRWGDSAAARLVLRDLRVTGATGAGHAGAGVRLETPVSGPTGHVLLERVTLAGNAGYGLSVNPAGPATNLALLDSSFTGNATGLRMDQTVSLSGLAVTGCLFAGNGAGIEVYQTAAGTTRLDQVSVAASVFADNARVGAYFEKLSDAVFSGLTVATNGDAGISSSGIDLDLKYAAYSNIVFRDCVLTANGDGSPTGSGLAIKARNDGLFATRPARLAGLTVAEMAIADSINNLVLGNNLVLSSVTVTGVQLTGGSVGLWLYGTATGTLVVTRSELRNNGYGIYAGSANVDARSNWWGSAAGPGVDANNPVAVDPFSNPGGVILTNPFLTTPPFDNLLYLEPTPASLFIRPTETALVDLVVARLLQPVNGVQAFLWFSSTYFKAGPTEVGVAPGGGIWDELVYDVWNAAGDLDIAVGVDLSTAGGTQSDGTAAILGLAAAGVEGITRVEFRADPVFDPYLIGSTYYSDTYNQPVWPARIGSANIFIDGTPPTIVSMAATQVQAGVAWDVKDSVRTVLRGTVVVQVAVTDALSGPGWPPPIALAGTNGAVSSASPVAEVSPGVYVYQWVVEASIANGTWTAAVVAVDRAGNTATNTFTLLVYKNEAAGSVSFETFRIGGAWAYFVDRRTIFTATDAGGAVLATWTQMVRYVNNTTSGVAVGSYRLQNLPPATAYLSAKNTHALRRRLPAATDPGGTAFVNYMAANVLMGGDLSDNNVINAADYSILNLAWFTTNPAADINGDGIVNLVDYGILKTYWFKLGDQL